MTEPTGIARRLREHAKHRLVTWQVLEEREKQQDTDEAVDHHVNQARKNPPNGRSAPQLYRAGLLVLHGISPHHSPDSRVHQTPGMVSQASAGLRTRPFEDGRAKRS